MISFPSAQEKVTGLGAADVQYRSHERSHALRASHHEYPAATKHPCASFAPPMSGAVARGAKKAYTHASTAKKAKMMNAIFDDLRTRGRGSCSICVQYTTAHRSAQSQARLKPEAGNGHLEFLNTESFHSFFLLAPQRDTWDARLQ